MLRKKTKTQSNLSKLCCLLILTMLFSMVGAGNLIMPGTAAAADNEVLAVGSVSGAAGETVTVPVNLTSSGLVAGVQFDLSFDQNLLTYQSRTRGSLTSVMNENEEYVYSIASSQPSPDSIRVMIYSTTNTPIAAGTGSLVNLKFQIAPEAQAGQSTTLAFCGIVKLVDRTGDVIPSTVINGQFNIPGIQPPVLTADTTDNIEGRSITLSFTDDAAWRGAITDITVNDTSIAGKYSVAEGTITIDGSVFTAGGDYSIVVKAAGYTDANVTQTIESSASNPADFEISDGIITKYKGAGGDVIIPGNLGITAIGDGAFKNCSSVTSISIPNGVTGIGKDAFYGCGGMASISIPDGVTSIGNSAFRNCTSLTSISIPNGVTAINANSYMFNGCSSLTSINIPASVTSISIPSTFDGCSSLTAFNVSSDNLNFASEEGVLFNKDKTKIICCPDGKTGVYNVPTGVTGIGSEAFKDCNLSSVSIPEGVTSLEISAFYQSSNLTSVSIPETLTNIGASAFNACSKLTSLTIPGNVTKIGASAFKDCSSLTTLSIPNGVLTKLENNVFQNCSGLTSITIPGSVTSIGNDVFNGCSSLMSISIPENVTSIGTSAFYGCSSLTSIAIPGSVSSIGNLAFRDCSGLTSITIPGSVTSLGNSVFAGCSGLNSVNISEGITSIGNSMFQDCSSLASLTIPSSVTAIGNNAFSGCSSLTSITIPGSVTSLGTGAFKNCSSLSSVNFSEGLTGIGNDTFNGCSSLTSINIPASVSSIGNSSVFLGCSSLTAINVSSDNPNYASEEGVLFNKGKTTLVRYPTGKTGEYIVPAGITAIMEGAFKDCSNLSSVSIPEGVTSVENETFYGCSSLTTISIPESITGIGNSAFRNCSSLASIVIPGSVTGIGDNAFRDCGNLTSITIPESVTSIGNYAFRDCGNLTSITIPESVTSIGSSTFSGCSNLTIYGKAGSYAETYAAQKSIPFKVMTTSPVYVLTPEVDPTYTAGTTEDGINTMTVNDAISGFKFFAVNITPVNPHSGNEAVVFTHLRNNATLSINVTKADFDQVNSAQAGFNVLQGDVVKVYIVDDLTNDTDVAPVIFQ